MSDIFCSLLDGNDANDGSSYAQRVKTISRATSLASPGTRVRIMQSTNPSSIGNATWTNLSDTVTLSSAVNKTVTNCESNWTASANVTCTQVTFPVREGSHCQSIAIASGFTTGKAAYFALGSQDFSAYQQICFWVQCSTTVSANTIRLSLCSDTTGDVQVNNFDINFSIGTANRWFPVVLDAGAALGASIQSVALYLQSDPGTVTIYLDNIFTATAPSSADSLTLNSIISKNMAHETWWAIQSISGTTIKLDRNPGNTSNLTSKYIGTTETVTTYKREMIQCAITTGNCQTTSANGTSGSYITLSGGWDTTDMSTQTGATWIDGQTGQGTGLNIANNYINLDPNTLGFSRFDTGLNINSSNAYTTGSVLGCNNNKSYGINFSSGSVDNFGDIGGTVGNDNHGILIGNSGLTSIGTLYNSHSNGGSGLFISSGKITLVTGASACNNQYGINMQDGGLTMNSLMANNNSIDGMNSSGNAPVYIYNMNVNSNSGYGIELGNASKHLIGNYTSAGNSSASIRVVSNAWAEHYFNNPTISDSTMISGFTNYKDQRVCLNGLNGTVNNNFIYTDGGYITVDTSDPHTPGGLDYTVYITSTNRVAMYPIKFSIAKVAVNAGSLVTLSAYIKRSSSSISAKLIVPGGQIAGVPSDVSTNVTGTSYTQFSVSFTPSAKGVVELFAYVWAGVSTTDYIRIADLTITQV